MVTSFSDSTLHSIPVRGDKGKLRQVLINLLGNAVKFTESGHVTLRVVATNNSQPSTFTFEIIDSGPGIPAEAQEKVFAPFVQVGEGAKKGGTGLGLAICRRLAELMGGTIGLRSVAGEGSSFFFTVPLAPAQERLEGLSLPDQREPKKLAPGHKLNALIVDDVEENRDVLYQILASLGCQSRLAQSGEQALELIRLETPDIVFTDIRMAGMSGFELKTKIEEEFGSARLRIAAISASVLDHEQKNYLEGGFDEFIGKPYRVRQIADCLARSLSVEFEYEPRAETEEESQMSDPVEATRVLLPDPLLARLRTSAKSYRIVEFNRCLTEVEQLGAEGRRLAASLEALNQKGDMEKILEILDRLDR